jgi:Immunoglobulin-like domain of bacterial spore germination
MEEVMIMNWLGHKRLACLAILGLMLLALGATPAQATAEATAQATVVTDTLQNVRFGDHVTFERAVIDLGHDRIPGQFAPTFSSSYRDGDWIAKVKLPAVTATSKTDGASLERAISKYHVVRSPGTAAGLFVDFHLIGAARSVDVFKLDNPARIVIDVTPGEMALFPRPAAGAHTVVTKPRVGNLVGPATFTVRGYGRPFEASGAWRIKDAGGSVVRQGTYTTNDWTETWGSFKFSASYPARLSGCNGTLQVGEFSPKDGTFEGVSVPLKFR